jgi:hypothetical protein
LREALLLHYQAEGFETLKVHRPTKTGGGETEL